MSKRVEFEKYRHRISIKQPVRTADGQGGNTVVKGVDKRLWARIQPVTEREVFEHRQIKGRLTHKISVRHANLDNLIESEVHFGTRVFRVLGFMRPDEIKRTLLLLCQEDRANG